MLKIDPNLGRLAIRQKLEMPFVIWAILRQSSIDTKSSSHYSKKSFKSLIAQSGLTYNRRHFSRLLLQGEGIFWRLGAKKVYLISLANVTNYFKQHLQPCDYSENIATQSIGITVTKSIEAIRAEIYFAWFAQFPEKLISRATLTDLFGLSPAQQRAYEKKLGHRLIVKTNYAHIDSASFRENPQSLPEYHFEIAYEREITRGSDIDSDFVGERQKVNAIQYQLPNTYFARPSTGQFIPSSDASNRAKIALLGLFRPVSSLKTNQRIYWVKRSQFERLANFESLLRVAWQGKKSLWILGHYS